MLNPTPSALSSLFLTRWFLASFFRVRGTSMFLIPNPGLQMTQIPDPEKVLETLKYWQYQESISFVTPTPPPTVVLCLVRPRSSLNSSQTLQRGVSRGEVQLGNVTASFPNHILISNLMKLLQNIQSVSALFRNVNPEISRKGQEASFEKTLPRKVSKEYEKSLLRKRQGLLHLFFSLEIVDNKDNFIIS